MHRIKSRRLVGAAPCASLTILIACAVTPAFAQSISRPVTGSSSLPASGVVAAALSITAPVLPTAVYAGQRTSAIVRVTNAKAGSTITVKPVAPSTAGSCGFVTLANAAPVTATANGTTEIRVPGMFPQLIGSAPSTCGFKAEVTATKTDGTTSTTVVNSSNVTLAPPTVYVLTNTSNWLGKFAFTNTSASGDCDGASNGPNGIFRVGLLASENGQPNPDLTFKIRSGPTGTRCVWSAQPFLLPEGVKLTNVEIAVQSSGPCSAVPATSMGEPAGFRSATNPVVDNTGTVVGANPLGAGYPVQGVSAMLLSLSCEKTLSNDRFVTLIIKSLTFVGPPGVSGFP